jgi:hypothetical protein
MLKTVDSALSDPPKDEAGIQTVADATIVACLTTEDGRERLSKDQLPMDRLATDCSLKNGVKVGRGTDLDGLYLSASGHGHGAVWSMVGFCVLMPSPSLLFPSLLGSSLTMGLST